MDDVVQLLLAFGIPDSRQSVLLKSLKGPMVRNTHIEVLLKVPDFTKILGQLLTIHRASGMNFFGI